jgi:hypothetical protein
MLEEIVVIVDDDRPALLAELGELLGNAAVNIHTLAASNINGQGIIHLVVDDGEDAGEVLAANGFKVNGTREVMSVTLDDQPGELGRYCRRLSQAGVSVKAVYVARREAGETELIFSVDDLHAAQTVFRSAQV